MSTQGISKRVYEIIQNDILERLSTRYGFNITEAKKLFMKKFITITIGDVAENDRNMEQIGEQHCRGYNLEEMKVFQKKFEKLGAKCEWHSLNDGLLGTKYEGQAEPAVVLIIRKGINVILKDKKGADNMMNEVDKDKNMDKKVWSRTHKRTVNKLARWNNCFGKIGQEPNIEQKKGRIVPYSEVPLLYKIISWFLEVEREFGSPETYELFAEGNYYYNEKCGIGGHGDSERKKAIGLRMGRCAPLGYRWRIHHKGVGKTMTFEFDHGDMYIMSEKAVGTDWKKSATLQLVHAAGAPKYMKQLER